MTGLGVYRIRVRGRLDAKWADWFAPMAICESRTGESILVGHLPDQAALYGVLNKTRDLGLELVSVNRVATEEGTGQDGD